MLGLIKPSSYLSTMVGQPNVILVAIDTLRADRLSCYGFPRETSPNIDRLAREGVLFTQAVAPGIPTHPGFTTIFTGMHPLRHGIVCHAGSKALDWGVRTLPEVLRELGYVTIAVDNLVATRGLWFVRGFDYYVYTGGITVISRGAKITGEVVTRKALEVIELLGEGRLGGRPFFLFIHYWDPHTPYMPPHPFREKFYRGGGTRLSELLRTTAWGRLLLESEWIRALIEEGRDEKEYVDSLYEGEVCYADHCLGRVLEKLEEAGLYDESLIIVTSDHGELLGEKGIYYDHHGLYEPDVRIPLIMRHPELGEGVRVDEVVTQEDIAPTILDLLGRGELLRQATGRSLLPLIRGEGEGRGHVILVENTRMTKRAIRAGRWKLVQTLRDDPYGRPAGYVELYDLGRGEEENLAESEPELVRELLGMLEYEYRRLLGGRGDPLILQPISLPIPGAPHSDVRAQRAEPHVL